MPTIRRSAAIAVASGVAVASLVAPAAATAGKHRTTTNPAEAAATYLADQLAGKHHNHYIGSYPSGGMTIKYADYGETADAILSMDAAGVDQKAAARATSYLEKHVNDYALLDSPPDYYPGSVAKLLLVAEAQHVDPESFGGVDLTGAIVGTEDGGGTPGEYQNPGDPTFPSITIQSLAVLALATAPHFVGASDNAVSFLLAQQCADGSFGNDIRDDTSTPCAAGTGDVDATAYAVQALEATNQEGAAKQAVTWLKSVEKPNGGWPEASGKADANSTALAIEARLSAGKSAKDGEKYLGKAQLGCDAPKSQRGGVTYQGTYDAASTLRATSQAGVALAGTDLTEISNKHAKNAAPVPDCSSHHKKK